MCEQRGGGVIGWRCGCLRLLPRRTRRLWPCSLLAVGLCPWAGRFLLLALFFRLLLLVALVPVLLTALVSHGLSFRSLWPVPDEGSGYSLAKRADSARTLLSWGVNGRKAEDAARTRLPVPREYQQATSRDPANQYDRSIMELPEPVC